MVAQSKAVRVRLSRTKIVEAALTLLEEGGDLTFRQLGSTLGADPTAIYRHFDSKEDLLLAVVDYIAEEIITGWQPTGDWRIDLTSLMHRGHDAYQRRPRLAKVTAMRTAAGEHEMALVEQILVALRRAGLTGETLVRTYRAFIVYQLGFVIGQSVHVSNGAAALAADRQAWVSVYRNAPADRYPTIAELGPLLPTPGETPEFEDGLELLLDGIEALAQRTA